ncbi:hypothetical protein HN858_00360 [Candidatus Falkowbacteria bacterium]|jgi:hypothetical protein|nr:hypothetical protein [Candidatus Falkowbacteria bacterium]MBT5503621.1 hypothetical protein [Candidatus Falkowbacteria bacterium]MBT6574481.1 hypothetical protein [Candidatus Falkowbacteria bacterium]MBT7348105.1 hypothetical protein [Candidatus Falkowbacteria bacterium]MBT7500748.1 hypothetical protein [Candidatus Falkowbacteria bacterium]
MSTEQPKTKMTAEFLDKLILNDFPNNGFDYVYTNIQFALRFPNKINFYERIDPEVILTFDQYLTEKIAPKFNLLPPDVVPEETQAKIDIANKLSAELKQSLQEKKPIKEIYQLLKNYRKQLGDTFNIIPELE